MTYLALVTRCDSLEFSPILLSAKRTVWKFLTFPTFPFPSLEGVHKKEKSLVTGFHCHWKEKKKRTKNHLFHFADQPNGVGLKSISPTINRTRTITQIGRLSEIFHRTKRIFKRTNIFVKAKLVLKTFQLN